MNAIADRVRLMLGRANVGLVNDASQLQELQVEMLADELQDGVERFQQYGFTSHPHPGAEAISAAMGGLRSHVVILSVDDRRYRLTGLQQGEVALHDDLGNVVLLGRDGIVVTGAAKVSVAAPQIEATGESTVTVTAPQVLVDSANVQLGGAGGKAVARVDDLVDLATGKIISGSDKVTAA